MPLKRCDWSTPDKKSLKNNKNPRYHYLNFSKDKNIPPMIIDFKHYFSLSIEKIEYLKKQNFYFRIKELFRDEINQRFAYFLSRIALPDTRTNKK